jgi:hypothetical protein
MRNAKEQPEVRVTDHGNIDVWYRGQVCFRWDAAERKAIDKAIDNAIDKGGNQ